jgi:catechol 2,3-dioxygenase-like lactoylglutathione lyase family enzyme
MSEFDGVLETALYHDPSERDEMERFYAELLGLPVVARWPDGTALRVGAGVLLLFDRAGLAEREGPIADHGTSGPGHACLRAGGERYQALLGRLVANGVEITHEHDWDGGARSFYFHDPAGNLIEIADRDLWPGSTDNRPSMAPDGR